MTLYTGLIIVSLVFFVFFMAILFFFIFHRVFKRIKVSQAPVRKIGFVYQEHVGDYRKNMIILEELIKKVQEERLPVSRAAMIYYDDPRKKKKSELKSDVGLIIDAEYSSNINTQLPYRILAGENIISAQFPYVSRFSILFGAMKVFPSFRRYLKKIEKNEGPMIEIYDFEGKKIEYLMPFT